MADVLFDAGHGGHDAGTTTSIMGGLREKDIALKFAQDVSKALSGEAKIGLTRDGDYFLTLKNRSDMANRDRGLKAFVSIHLNAPPSGHGAEVYAYQKTSQGYKLAQSIHNELKHVTPRDRGVKTANFYVLRKTAAPAALVELGFLGNPKDMQHLFNNWDKYVMAVAKGVGNFIGVKVKDKPNIPKHQTGKVLVSILGEYVSIDGFNKDDKNYIYVQDNYLPIRDVLEAFALEVGWNNEHRVVTADTSKKKVEAKETIKLRWLGVNIDVPGYKDKDINMMKINDMYFPIRDVLESMGFKVGWNQKDKIVEATK